ncbi:hypothetical protein Y032_0153g2941 [Ancylostoma ceylanicum]|uniref:Helix-turn-helix domain-containing protein n=1 Tax=Ancylostoma ceylanicum TaxID=53326 RepID=A0A016T0B3_9BILA|nr:hypothetical protein Y032_0153g2941 [Ancylostoma ceylanicum]
MDDLLIMHNTLDNTILTILNEVYCGVLSLETTHESNYKCNYLDLEINIRNNTVITKMYNKTDSFGFPIKRFPHFFTNISIGVKKATIYAEVLRIARTCSTRQDFVNRLRRTKNILLKMNYNKFTIESSFLRCLFKNNYIIFKFNINTSRTKDFVKEIF